MAAKNETKKALRLVPVDRSKLGRACVYDEVRDVKKVVSGLAVDVDDMLQTGVVKDSSATLDNNGIDDPNNIIGRVTDEFAAIDAQRAIRKYGKERKAAQQKALENAAKVNAPAPTPPAE